MLRIVELSKLSQLSVKTIRYYADINLLKPYFIDDNGYRYYKESQLKTLLKIKDLRELDMSIEEIKSLLNGKDYIKVLNNHLNKLKDESKRINNNISLIKQYINKEKKMKNYVIKEINIKDYICYVRHGVIKSMNDLNSFVLEAGEEVRKNNPTLKCVDYCYVTYTAKEYKEKDIELEYIEAVEKKGKDSKNIKFKTIKGCKAISILHKGSYSELPNAYSFILNYVKDKKLSISGDIREVYIDGCWNKSNEKDYLTEIQVPIK